MDRRISNNIGYLILKEDGAVIESGGELENDEHIANVFWGLIKMTETIDENFMSESGCEKISVVYDSHSYTMCRSNRLIYVVKQLHTSFSGTVMESTSNTNACSSTTA